MFEYKNPFNVIRKTLAAKKILIISMYSCDQLTSLPISNQCLVFYALNLLDDMTDLQGVTGNVYIASKSSI